MKELNQHKFKFNPYLEDLYQSDKPLIIYKVDDGYNIYTDFSKKIILTKKNIHKFLNSLEKKKYKKETDLYLGFFGYEILCNLIGINLKNKKRINFYKGIFYKPETIIKIRKDIKVISSKKKHKFNYQFNKTQILSPFKINISYAKYKKIFELLKITLIKLSFDQTFSISNKKNIYQMRDKKDQIYSFCHPDNDYINGFIINFKLQKNHIVCDYFSFSKKKILKMWVLII